MSATNVTARANGETFVSATMCPQQCVLVCQGPKALINEDTLLPHDVSWAAQTGKHLLRTQHISEQNQKHLLCPGHKIRVCNKCCAGGQTGKHLCR